MLHNSEMLNEFEPPSVKASNDKARILYQKPQLESLGDLRTLTLGGSPGVADSSTGSMCEFSGFGGDGSCD